MANLDQIDAVLKITDREVWVLTSAAGEWHGGLTATFVSSASIDRDRPQLLVSLGHEHFTTSLIAASGRFAAHLLRADQAPLAWNFAHGSSRERDKLAGLAVVTRGDSPPILADCLAWCDCRVFARVGAGDRLLFWADVVAAERLAPGPPLREQEFFRSLTAEQRGALAAARTADALAGRTLHQEWRERAGA
ncbi:MAG: flavin reductase family protein [Pirellulaceae bacterium]|nr:flavin reductase family protein [Pirellulaceae bacterium]